ncbi:BgTH12-03374 [Blumeria graminis f. sp. triticale]|uniref:Bgt-51396 n=2 Tax=Blumeria graminis TaxID=34373 RepID=A0A9X9MJL1_BLUGR|nr:BgTH12-03374 [Blumeria graminis f. sp. triticale]VDB89928.1 Bgt-51396 [Blumeria graminis f. sp. tritici]
MVWKVLMSLHQSTGTQTKVDMIWNFWSKRCSKGASVREHIGHIRSLHIELAETGIIIEVYLVAILMSESLPPSYDSFVSTIFAGIRDLEQADPNYVANKIFEEEMRRNTKYGDVHIVSQKHHYNCKKPGHLKDYCCNKGGGKEGQAPWKIAKKKKEENDVKIKGQNQTVQVTDQDVFYFSNMVEEEKSPNKYKDSTFYSWSCNSWVADSGASAHIANQRDIFATFTPCIRILNVAGGLTTTFEGIGMINMQGLINGTVRHFRLLDVLFVPTTRFCLI